MFANSRRLAVTDQLIDELKDKIKKRKDKSWQRHIERGLSEAEWDTIRDEEDLDLRVLEALREVRHTLPRAWQEGHPFLTGRAYIAALESLVPYITASEKYYRVLDRPENDPGPFDELYVWVMHKVHRFYWENGDPHFKEVFFTPKEPKANPADGDSVTVLRRKEEQLGDDVIGMQVLDPAPSPA